MTALAAACGQLLWVGFDGTTLPSSLAARIAAQQVGGALLFRRNVESLEQVAALVAALHAAAPADAPLTVSLDQEGGRVARVRAPATEWPPMLRLGELHVREPARAVALARRVGEALGKELAALGFDLDYAPVLDVLTNAANPVIGDRAFALTPADVIALAGAFADGLAAASVLACGKHFPGHGDTHLDSHLALPRVDHELARLRAVELAPFAALAPRLPTLMTAHVIFGAIDPELPATLSPRVLDGVLRRELGFGGVIISDDLEMKAIADHFGIEDAVVRGLLAGCDVFLLCHREGLQLAAHEALVRAAEADVRVRERVRESAARIAALKASHASRRLSVPAPSPSVLGCAAHQALSREVGEAAAGHDPTDRRMT